MTTGSLFVFVALATWYVILTVRAWKNGWKWLSLLPVGLGAVLGMMAMVAVILIVSSSLFQYIDLALKDAAGATFHAESFDAGERLSLDLTVAEKYIAVAMASSFLWVSCLSLFARKSQ